MPSTTSRRWPRPGNGTRRACTGLAAAAAGAGLLAGAAPAAADAPTLTRDLTQGTHGADVARVQKALHVDGTRRFDARTKRAVIRFQRNGGLLVDGIVGTQTWDALFHITPPATSTTSTTDTGSTSYSSGSGGYSIPSGIVECESGGDYSAVNSSSGAGGAYQILPSTWQAYGGQGLPEDAPKSEQDRIAGEIYAQQGSSAWTC
jgi:peptidoglycan hydrolase-like protein with peptidoglycan-binding domain